MSKCFETIFCQYFKSTEFKGQMLKIYTIEKGLLLFKNVNVKYKTAM